MTYGAIPAEEPTTDQDRLVAAGSYLSFCCLVIPLICILLVLFGDAGRRRFPRYNAINGAVWWATSVALGVIWGVISRITAVAFDRLGTIGDLLNLGIGCAGFILGLGLIGYSIYLAIQAYSGKMPRIPWATNFAEQQGWMNPPAPPAYPPAGSPPPYPPPGSPPPGYPPSGGTV